jgi:hypothetical protein
VGDFGPKIEAEKDETLSQYLQNVVRRHQSSPLDLKHLRFRLSSLFKKHLCALILKKKTFQKNN